MVVHLYYVFHWPLQHPIGHEPGHVLAGPYDPYCPYHNAVAVSSDWQIDMPLTSKNIACVFHRFAVRKALEYDLSQPSGVAPIDAKNAAKDSRLVSTPKMLWI
jgi:hypothetical protein